MAKFDYTKHYFPYVTTNPWPFADDPQLDWITAVAELEYWLNNRIGPRLVRWTWINLQCRVAFARETDRTFFLLRWH